MANYGRGGGDGYGSQSREATEEHWDREARAEGDWDWLARSPRQQRLRAEQGLRDDEFAEPTK